MPPSSQGRCAECARTILRDDPGVIAYNRLFCSEDCAGVFDEDSAAYFEETERDRLEEFTCDF